MVKLLLPEAGSGALARHLATRPRRVSALLLRTEVLRAALRAGLSPARMLLAHQLLDGIAYVPFTLALSDEAGMLAAPGLRSLDAIHVATARSLQPAVAEMVTYDQRLAAAATWYGMRVVSPA